MSLHPPETHLVLVWARARPVLDRILADAGRRFLVRDVIEVTWRPGTFHRSLTRLYGTDLPAGSDKERECGTGPFVVIAIDDERPRTVARRTQQGWTAANARLLAAKRRYRHWAGGSYRVHTTLSPAETARDTMLLLGETPESLRGQRWDGTVRERRHDLLGDPSWDDVEKLKAALRATMPCAFLPQDAGDMALEVVTDDAWWAIRIVDPPAAESGDGPEARLRRPLVGGVELPVLVHDVADPDAAPEWSRLLPAPEFRPRPTMLDRISTLARVRR